MRVLFGLLASRKLMLLLAESYRRGGWVSAASVISENLSTQHRHRYYIFCEGVSLSEGGIYVRKKPFARDTPSVKTGAALLER